MLRRYKKGIALLLLITFAHEIFAPTAMWALTGGPSQPEVNSFEPVGTNQMVDLSSGDFNYNIPLMVVPGPNGSYPINLAYHAGIGMEQEASWVGLGWNINPGAITRNLRGVPDDFSGDVITKKTNLKTQVTVGASITTDQLVSKEEEKFSLKLKEAITPTSKIRVYYNNYKGVGYNFSAAQMRLIDDEVKTGNKYGFGLNFDFSFDSNTGLGFNLTPNISKQANGNHWNSILKGWNVGIGINTREGLESIRFEKGRKSKIKNNRFSSSLSFVNHTYVPEVNQSMTGFNTSASFSISKKDQFPITKKNQKIEGDVTTNKLANAERNYASFGGVYLENQEDLKSPETELGSEYNRMMDFNVYNDIPINRRSVNMGIPVMTSDLFLITGQGVGGMFRGHRNDVGRFYNAGNTSNTAILSGGYESAVGQDLIDPTITHYHTGYDAGVGFHRSYSGRWTGGTRILDDNDLTEDDKIKFQEKSTRQPLYEPFYFKVTGEKTARQLNDQAHINYEKPFAFDIGIGPSLKPIVKDYKNQINQHSKNFEREKRSQSIEYTKKDELISSINYSNRVSHLFNEEELPGVHTGSPINHNSVDGTEENVDHHIHEYSILGPNGSRYTYGLPAYNTLQEENVFANNSAAQSSGIDEYDDLDLINYDPEDASINNNEGVDHYYSSTEIPSYSHAHMITEITSTDYVDLTGNGLSEDDFGFYTKFNYTEVSDYKWRDPFYGADYIKGYYSNERDDKASFTYGEKNLYYVHSIETKTHVAIFELGERADGKGVNQRDQVEGEVLSGQSQRYLKKVTLYSKNDPGYPSGEAIPLQTVHFEYDYSLCEGVFNNDNSVDDAQYIQNNQGGKLTLKRVYITYNGNEKGRLSPYEFNYDSNPDYSRLNIDRWGNYQTPHPDGGTYENTINPYTRQDNAYAPMRDENAAAWNLSKIQLPSGGEINVEYESDEYGYVQNQRAAEMVQIYGFSETDVSTPVLSENLLKLKKKNLRLWFHAKELGGYDIDDIEGRNKVIADYIEGLDEIYFKAFTKLKRQYNLSSVAEDYVVGYAQVDPMGSFGAASSGENFGYIDLKPVEYKSAGIDIFKTHPLRRAGWQYLRFNRHDLFNDQGTYDSFGEGAGDALLSIPLTLASLVKEVLSTITLGQYNQYRILGYCRSMSTRKRSFVRLNSPNKEKYGGGHRVKSVKLSDNWIEGSREFGSDYLYENKDGSTSGVADYEPLVGGEENSLKKPIWYNGNDQLLNFQHQYAYLETPLSEALYPGARVVYGRVIEKNIDNSKSNENINEGQIGINVSEFYTAKDFPVETSQTKLNQKGNYAPFYVPFVGLTTINNRGFSQGYSIVLNDMSGKPKATSSYPYRSGEIEGLPISEVKYRYNVDSKGRLNNNVDVLDNHGVIRPAIVGVEQDFSIYEEQNNGLTENIGGEFNFFLSLKTTPSFPFILPVGGGVTNNYRASHLESMYRGISTSKVIYKTGILEEVEAFSDGSTVITKNLLYDAETGEALLTTVNNEWDKPVYNYSYAAHWNYDRMGGAYQNYRAQLYMESSGSDLLLFTEAEGDVLNAEDILTLGDEITVKEGSLYETYYVTELSGTNFRLQDEYGVNISFPSGKEGIITRSGRRNLQTAKSGSIVALSDRFLTEASGFSQQFSLWNSIITGADPNYGEDDPTYVSLETGLTNTYSWHPQFHFVPNHYNCSNGTYSNGFSIESINGTRVRFYTDSQCAAELIFRDGLGLDTPLEKGRIVPTDVGGIISYTEQLVNFEIIHEEKDVYGNTLWVEFKDIISGDNFIADWVITLGDCWQSCGVSDILHSDAMTYSDDWKGKYPYEDLGDPTIDDAGTKVSDEGINDYRYGKKGIWRAERTFLYQIAREQSADLVSIGRTKIDVDGEYQPWEAYSWDEGHLNPKWDWVSEITKYSPYGYAIEEKSRLSFEDDSPEETSIYSSQMYGYNNSVVTATSALATYFEIGFNGFEQGIGVTEAQNKGHISTNGTYLLSTEKSHTGEKSLKLSGGGDVNFSSILTGTTDQQLKGIEGKRYVVSMWVNVEKSSSNGTLTLFNGDSGILESVSTNESREIIDGWKKLEVEFIMPNTPVTFNYVSTGETFVDDIRVGPYDGGMMTYVYDPNNLWLMAELDGLNYATFYNYDSEGNLVQVKKETEKGIITIQTSRSNTVQEIIE